MLVFRDGKQTVSGPERLRGLIDVMRARALSSSHHSELLLDALLRAGELECALADAASASALALAGITDRLATELLGFAAASSAESLAGLSVPENLQISVPEGFAYYALHPLNYADLASRLENGRTAVIGIRSIGTTLSAIVAAALRREGVPASRMTVRPGGHPFDRQLEFDAEQRARIKAEREAGSEFWVVDEGPGLSGSSFLSVVEALERAGIPQSRIRLLCGSEPHPEQLRARNAAARWARYRVQAVAAPWRKPAGAVEDVSGGKWRKDLATNPWPGSWTQFERSKFVSESGSRLYKFEGFGRFGAAVAERAQRIAEGGYGPPPRKESEGYFSYAMLPGRTACQSVVDRSVLQRLAGYCAFRTLEFVVPDCDTAQLERMASWNYFEEFGEEGKLKLPLVRPTLVDGRMQRHEWIAGEWLLKTDGASHGDDHFFPGPADIAWDLAGTIIEWDLGLEAADTFIADYAASSGDHPEERLPAYLLAYSMFRLGYCKMAAEAMRGCEEEARLRRDYERYRAVAFQMKHRAAAA